MQRTVAVNGVELNVLEEGSGPPVIFAHGFPELAYSWRHQLPAVAAAGYRAVAPDQRGYGRSSRPHDLEAYDIQHLTGDLVALLDTLGEEKAVFVGHDWGAMVVWQLALLHPDRVAGVCGMSVPFTPRSPVPPLQIMRAASAGRFFYIVYFQDPGVADAELAADTALTMRRMLAGAKLNAAGKSDMSNADDGRGFAERLPEPERLPDWLSQAELDVYVEEFTHSGFTGPLNWYRNMDRNWAITPELDGAKVQVPSLFIGGTHDTVRLMRKTADQDPWLSDHRGTVEIEGAGHWVQQENPGAVNAALLAFLGALDLRS